MRRVMCILAILALAVPTFADDSGRTDGPEGSEYGKGGYRYWSTGGAYFLEGFVGAAVVDTDPAGPTDCVEHGVQDGPVSNGVATIQHSLCLSVR